MSIEQELKNAQSQAEYWKQLLIAARPYIEQAAVHNGYGYYRPPNPHDFSPDLECCTDEEVSNHKAACEAYDKGARMPCDEIPEQGDGWLRSPQGEKVAHILMAPWGIGSYTAVEPEAQEILDAIRKATTPTATG